ncbi:protein MARD1-like [Rhodamnia argentea]|uniref:Protein MARD1-like n=1 Tax=Rhodamnia argentea TaxID=178133 RepID=A0A8B8QIA5_9MYRT|nr:protein MARD1-like [Rhodamnia argentea]
MLRNRPRAVTGNKQALVADQRSQSTTNPQNNPTSNNKSIFPSFLASRFMHLTIKTALTQPKYVMVAGSPSSPTITHHINPFSHLKFPFWYQHYHQHPRFPEKFHGVDKHPFRELDSTTRAGLALVDTLSNNKARPHQESVVRGSDRLVLPGSRSKLEAPPVQEPAVSPSGSPNFAFLDDLASARRGCLSVSEMELSEDYTCVISHGPNPTATHIFGSSVVEMYCLSSEVKKQTLLGPDSFLSSCYTCKKGIEQDADIYIYRGEKAFCSSDCRYQEILQDEAEIVAEADGVSL